MLYAAVTALMVSPFIGFNELASATFAGDGRLMVWSLWWPLEAVRTGTPLFDAPLFHPSAQALRFNEHLLTPALLAAPITLLTGHAVLGCNLVWLCALWSNGLAAHALTWFACRRHLPAIISGLVFGWGFYRMLHLGHVHLQLTAGIPLLLVALARWHGTPSPGRLAVVFLLGLALVLTSWYIAVLAMCAAGLWILWLFVSGLPPTTRHTVSLAVAAMLGAMLVTPFALPYARSLTPSSVQEVRSLSADLASYVVPPTNTLLGHRLQGVVHTRWIWGEQTLFLGWTALALAAVGLVAFWRPSAQSRPRGVVGFAALLVLVAFGFSLGPSEAGFSPFDLLATVPGLSLFRAPGRFGLLVLLGVSLLAGFGALAITSRLPGVAAVVAVATLGAACLAEYFPVGAGLPRAEVLPTPPIYRLLDALPDGAVVSLPDHLQRGDWPLNADYLLFAVEHRRPIVNGFGRAAPPEYRSIIEQLSTFPSAASTDLARALGVRYLVVHTARLGTDTPVRAGEGSAALRLHARMGDDYLFSID